MVLRSPLFYSKIGFGLVCSGRLALLCSVAFSLVLLRLVPLWQVS